MYLGYESFGLVKLFGSLLAFGVIQKWGFLVSAWNIVGSQCMYVCMYVGMYACMQIHFALKNIYLRSDTHSQLFFYVSVADSHVIWYADVKYDVF